MKQKIPEYTIYNDISATELRALDDSFEYCQFIHCDLSYANLSNIRFIDCVFDDCNLSLAKCDNTGLQNVAFNNCKITGVNFSACNDFLFSVGFNKCIMDFTIWHKKKIKNTQFTDCNLNEADFAEADLTGASFDQCSLSRTIFNNTMLRGADFRTAMNIDIDPEQNDLTKAKFSIYSLPGLLSKHDLDIE